jgi:hypothetical protein
VLLDLVGRYAFSARVALGPASCPRAETECFVECSKVAFQDVAFLGTSNWAAHRSIGSSLAGATSLLERRASKPQPVVVGLLLIGGQGSRTRHGGTPETSAGSFDSWWVA